MTHMCQNKFDTYGAIPAASLPDEEIDTYGAVCAAPLPDEKLTYMSCM